MKEKHIELDESCLFKTFLGYVKKCDKKSKI